MCERALLEPSKSEELEDIGIDGAISPKELIVRLLLLLFDLDKELQRLVACCSDVLQTGRLLEEGLAVGFS